MGLGACWCGVWPVEERIEITQSLLDMPEDKVPFCVVAVGTDDEHPLSTNEIIRELAALGIAVERKTLPMDIEALERFGYDIICERGLSNSYHIGERVFELPELKLLADAVESSHFITQRKSRSLINKLKGLTSRYQAAQLQRQVFISERVKTQNENVYLNIDSIHTAIGESRKVTFRYFDYDISKTKIYRHGGERYVVSPYGLAWVNENYYMIGYYDRRGAICHFRVDKMERLKLSDDRQIYLGEDVGFNVADYVKKVFHMYSGEMTRVLLRFDNSLLNVVIDRFGDDARLAIYDGDSFTASVEVSVSPTFLSWLFQFGNKAAVLSPAKLIEQMKTACLGQLSQYGQ